MKIVRICPFTQAVKHQELDITLEQIAKYNSGTLLQDAFPNLTASEREFYLTGITDDEWDKLEISEDEE